MSDADEHFEAVFDDGEVVRMTRANTGLYTFWDELSMYDHVCIAEVLDTNDVTEDTSDTEYVHVFSGEEKFEGLVKIIQEYNFPQFLNQVAVLDLDVDAFLPTSYAISNLGLVK
jgi:hypothetical protein